MIYYEAKDFPVGDLEATGEYVEVHVPAGTAYRTYELYGDRGGSIAVYGDGDGAAYRWGNGDGDAYRYGDGNGSAHRYDFGAGNAVRDGGGNGNARRDGFGAGYAYRGGTGDGDAVRDGDGDGDAVRDGTGNGDARRNRMTDELTANVTTIDFGDLTITEVGVDGIRRSFDEHYDTVRDVEQDPWGAMLAIHKQARRIEELEAEIERLWVLYSSNRVGGR
jgi:hypothetical protein